MEATVCTGESGVPELHMVADESSAQQLSKCFLVGKIISVKSISKHKKPNMAQKTLVYKWFPPGAEGMGPGQGSKRHRFQLIHLLGTKYMRIQVELDIRKPIPTGFLQRMGKEGSWIQLCYERLIEFCYNCGLIGHGKSSCSQPLSHNQITNGDLYGPWLRVEADAFTINPAQKDEDESAHERVRVNSKFQQTSHSDSHPSRESIQEVHVDNSATLNDSSQPPPDTTPAFPYSNSTFPAPSDISSGPDKWVEETRILLDRAYLNMQTHVGRKHKANFPGPKASHKLTKTHPGLSTRNSSDPPKINLPIVFRSCSEIDLPFAGPSQPLPSSSTRHSKLTKLNLKEQDLEHHLAYLQSLDSWTLRNQTFPL
ncbi:hypothetical protein FEM48_ZijujUnG0122700 [Ziziphus jujuba var. spinosa]|uniref:CCHC-type domain-containing protein n=1 Tax=Ziziphus jujuba var. spinosa TaxID=714518 RepID=A0A978U7T8_ZIZJJ|nr:hypothetical protein FEM48_ZijujUnG0122700 [Ziziphus jujuba var. spinosa]